MKYEIYSKPDAKYDKLRVLFEDGTDYCVNTDTFGREYFPVPNTISGNTFNGKIKDAIETIRNGDGDVLSIGSIFGFTSESVFKYVDLVYGEEMRMKTIEGFKDTIFGYSIKFGYNNSMSGGNYVSKDKQLLLSFNDKNNYIYFDTEQEANDFKNILIAEATELVKKYNEIKDKPEKISEYVDLYMNNIVTSELILGMISEKKWYLKVVQVIKA